MSGAIVVAWRSMGLGEGSYFFDRIGIYFYCVYEMKEGDAQCMRCFDCEELEM